MEIGDHDEPVVNAEPWNTIVLCDSRKAKFAASSIHRIGHEYQTRVREKNRAALIFGVNDSIC